jgi:hypothetical protein
MIEPPFLNVITEKGLLIANPSILFHPVIERFEGHDIVSGLGINVFTLDMGIQPPYNHSK